MDCSRATKKTPLQESFLSGREDLNLRPLAPHASALAGLRHAPMYRVVPSPNWQGRIIAVFEYSCNSVTGVIEYAKIQCT